MPNDYHKTNLTLWGAVVSSVIILSIVVFMMDSNGDLESVAEAASLGQAFFISAIILAAGILFLKRTIFSPGRLINKLHSLPETEREAELYRKLRRNYLVIWAMAELICFIGFFYFIVIGDVQNYLIFAVVSIYSLMINMPREGLIYQCLELLKE